MERPDNVLPSTQQQPNPNQSIYVTSHSAFANLMSIMAQMDPLFNEFQRLHAEAAAARNPNPNNTLFSPSLQVLMDYDCMGFVSNYYGILGILQRFDSTNSESVQHSKFLMFDSIRSCESYFAKFNQKYQAAPEILRIIANMSIVFTDIKRELGQLGLYDVPRFDLTQEVPNANSSAQNRGRREDAPEEENSTVRKRFK